MPSTEVNPPTSSSHWTSTQAYVLAVICLLVGMAAGYLLRGSSAANPPVPANPPAAAAPDNSTQVTPGQLAAMGKKQAEPLLEQLKTNPADPALLAQIAGVYYDTQQYGDAIEYYQKSLKLAPDNVDVRTDYGTCLWYQGNADAALAEYQKALSADPEHANTLFNLGMVKWQGKSDVKGAIAAWEKLLQTNPNYPEKDHVVELIAKAKEHASGSVGQIVPKN
jgi:cytochrome c-type biogenesis protein CcmH/NrfG